MRDERFSCGSLVLIAVSVAMIGSAKLVAAPISITMKSTSFSILTTPTPGPDVRLRLAVDTGGFPNAAAPTTLSLPGIGPDSGDRMINYQIGDAPSHTVAIRREDAAGYGFDWDGFESRLVGQGKNIFMQFGVPYAHSYSSATAYVNTAINATGLFPTGAEYGFSNFEMEEIRMQVDYYFWHPVLTSLRAAKVSFEVVGSGNVIVVPEPTTACALPAAVLAVLLRRRRRSGIVTPGRV